MFMPAATDLRWDHKALVMTLGRRLFIERVEGVCRTNQRRLPSDADLTAMARRALEEIGVNPKDIDRLVDDLRSSFQNAGGGGGGFPLGPR
jgi:hypothetical protein